MRLRLLAAVGSLIALAATSAPAALAAPPRLSTEHSAPSISSTYGSGSFGTWTTDAHKLPAYRYEIDELTSPIAPQPELSGNTNAWSQVGNDHIVADASNHGYTQLWSQDRLYQWTNYYDPGHNHFAGGFGYLNAGGRVISTLYDDRPAGATTSRVFGVGYYEQRTTVKGLATIQGRVYAPFGDDSLLLHDVTIRNTSGKPLDGSYFEYWDLNPEIQGVTQLPRGYQSPSWDPQTRTLSAAQLPDDIDTEPLTIFASALQAPVSAYDTDTSSFFGSGTRAAPAAVLAGQLGDSIAPPAANGVEGSGMFAFQSPVSLAPGASITLRYAYGYAHPERIQPMLARYATQPGAFNQSEAKWSKWLPKVQIGGSDPWLSRELEWDAYTLRSDATYEDCAGRHILSQGGYYQYFFGENEAFRDPLQHAMPMIWADPALARDVIAYSAEEQPSVGGAIPYGLLGMCKRFDLGSSDDLDQWLLWAAAEYSLSTRDFSFLDEHLRYSDTGSGTVWEHLKLAFHHQEEVIGRGPHGEYITGATGDWNDFSTEFNQMTESNLVTAQAAYIYPRLALVADRLGDSAFAGELRAAAARDEAVVAGQWIEGEHVTSADAGLGWFARGFSGANQLGSGAIYVEPQPWALLAGAASTQQARELVAAYRRFLVGIGAPMGPTRIGAAMAPGSTDPGANEQNEPGLNNSREFPGGAWFALNGLMTWALADLEGVVPQATEYAWDEFLRNTLATHANVFPDHWDGIISVDDECASYYQSPPSGCGIGLATGAGAVNGYDTQIMHQPAYALFDLLKLAGVEATQDGYDVVPHLPTATFDIRLPNVGVAEQSGLIRGYVTTSGGSVTMRVAPPPGVPAQSAVAYAGATQVPCTVVDGLVQFTLPTRAGHAADWAVSGP